MIFFLLIFHSLFFISGICQIFSPVCHIGFYVVDSVGHLSVILDYAVVESLYPMEGDVVCVCIFCSCGFFAADYYRKVSSSVGDYFIFESRMLWTMHAIVCV